MAEASVASLVFILAAISAIWLGIAEGEGPRKPYIVQVVKSAKPHHFTSHQKWYASMLHQVSQLDPNGRELLYAYDTVLHGFAATLSRAEAEAMESMDGCLAVIPSSVHEIAITRTPDFLGLDGSSGVWEKYSRGKDIIVGVIDTGIWPESKSFNDAGLGPVPSRWKGMCQAGQDFNSSNCNNKIIGARYYSSGYEEYFNTRINAISEYKSPRDSNGHGTHVASTVAGAPVNVSSRYASGMARGMAPQARLAIYKTCWQKRCEDSDVIAAIDQAVADGVDIISFSIASPDKPFYDNNPRVIAAFGAIRKGVLFSAAAGNSGPDRKTLRNTAPWIMSVGASSVDRDFPAFVLMGNANKYRGTSTYEGDGKLYGPFPLVYASANDSSRRCLSGSLDRNLVEGKIVVCDKLKSNATQKGNEVARAGGKGMIVANEKPLGAQQFITHPNTLPSNNLPAISVSYWYGEAIKVDIEKKSAEMDITGLTVVGNEITAPAVAAFSSRGPSTAYPLLLKPDMIAPGVNILAAVGDGYEFMSGSSMACPHVSGVAALIKAIHPTWSPAAIKSALMTSSYILDNAKQPIRDSSTMEAADPFAMGAGHINPEAAMDPGLVYDMETQDYIKFLCSFNDTKQKIGLLNESCPESSLEAADLNYPSFYVDFKSGSVRVQEQNRKLTYVGSLQDVKINTKLQNLLFCPMSDLEADDLSYPPSSLMFSSVNKSVEVEAKALWSMTAEGDVEYHVTVDKPRGVEISVEPQQLKFKTLQDKASYSVTFENVKKAEEGTVRFGEITWTSIKGGQHIVRSRVVVVW